MGLKLNIGEIYIARECPACKESYAPVRYNGSQDGIDKVIDLFTCQIPDCRSTRTLNMDDLMRRQF